MKLKDELFDCNGEYLGLFDAWEFIQEKCPVDEIEETLAQYLCLRHEKYEDILNDINFYYEFFRTKEHNVLSGKTWVDRLKEIITEEFFNDTIEQYNNRLMESITEYVENSFDAATNDEQKQEEIMLRSNLISDKVCGI